MTGDVVVHEAQSRSGALPAWSLPADAVERHRAPRRVARAGHTGLGVGRGDRRGRPRLRARQRHRGRASARRRAQERWPSRSTRTTRRSSRKTPRATSAATARPAPGSSARSRRSASSYSVRVLGAGYTGSGAGPARGPALGDRAGLRRHQHEPLDDQEQVRGRCCTSSPTPPTSGARCSSPPPTTCRSRATRGASRPSSRSAATRSDDPRVLLQPRPAGRVLRAGRRRRGRLAGRRRDPRAPATASRRRTSPGICALDPGQASGADPVPAEERALPDGDERGGRTDDRATSCAPRWPRACSAREEHVPGAAAVDRRGRAGDLQGQGRPRSSCSTRRPTSSSSRRSPATARTTLVGQRFPSEHRHRRLGARHAASRS